MSDSLRSDLEPACLVDLVIVVGGISRQITHQVKMNRLFMLGPVQVEPIRDVGQLAIGTRTSVPRRPRDRGWRYLPTDNSSSKNEPTFYAWSGSSRTNTRCRTACDRNSNQRASSTS